MADVEIFSLSEGDGFVNPGIPSMLTDDEKALYRSLARAYQGRGSVIEMGTWLGSGTYQICRGLEDSGRPWSLTVFDRFLWNEGYAKHYPQPGLSDGDSFMEAFLTNLSEFRSSIHPVAGDLGDIATLMPLDRDIELLYVDAPKSWRMLWRVMDHVGPHFAPGSRLLFQDFFHLASRQLVWLLMAIPQLKLKTIVRRGVTAVFEADGPISDLAGTAPANVKSLTTRDLLEMWNRLRGEIPEFRHGELAIGMALDLIERRAFADAEALLTECVVEASNRADTVHQLVRQKRKATKEAASMTAVLDFVEQGAGLQASLVA